MDSEKCFLFHKRGHFIFILFFLFFCEQEVRVKSGSLRPVPDTVHSKFVHAGYTAGKSFRFSVSFFPFIETEGFDLPCTA